jgi:hypothetical protein
MKGNFFVDPDFPVIDALGHPDKIDFHRVKGGGSTNTTNFDLLRSGVHHYSTARSTIPVPTSLADCIVGPNFFVDNAGVLQSGDPRCVNSPPFGDADWTRSSDRFLMDRLEISGVVTRPGGSWDYPDSELGGVGFNIPSPKCFVAVVLDLRSNYALPPFNSTGLSSLTALGGPFCPGAGEVSTGGGGVTALSACPLLNHIDSGRFRVLAYDVLDFAGELGRSVLGSKDELYRSSFVWSSVSKGFRFDIDLNNLIGEVADVSYPSTYAHMLCNSIYVYSLNFNGVDLDAFTFSAFDYDIYKYLTINYRTRLSFFDCNTPFAGPVSAGADGGVVPDDDVDPLNILADQSAVLAGLPALPDSPIRSKRQGYKKKARFSGPPDRGARQEARMLFDDDPEVALLSDRAWRGSSKAPRFKKYRPEGEYDDSGKRSRNY